MRRYRERAGFSREDLADLIGVHTRTLQRVENEGVAGMPVLKRVCKALRLPVLAVLQHDAEAVRGSLRAYGFAPGLPPPLVGRDGELAVLEASLTTPQTPRVPVIIGPVGVGKTSLAQRLAQDMAGHFEDGVVWVRCDFDEARLVELDIARALGFEAHLPPPGQDTGGRDWRQAFAAHFWQGRRLLVLDDASDAAQVTAFSAGDERATILVTTRFKHVAEEVATARANLGPLAQDAIVELLMSPGVERSRLEADREGLERLLELIDGRPGVAHLVHSALRRERLTTPASFLARFDLGTREAGADRSVASAVSYYDGLKPQLSAPAWQLFGALGAFGSEPMPLGWAAAAAGMSPGITQASASELLDAHVVDLYHAPNDDEPSPWLRLATHPALAARALLGVELAATRARIVAHLAAELGRCRAASPAALTRYYRRHHALILSLRRGLCQGLGSPPRLGNLSTPEAIRALAATSPPTTIDPARARLLLDMLSAFGPLLFDHTIADAEEWLGLGLLAARRLGDPALEGRLYAFIGWWRIINVGYAAQPALLAAAREALGRADRPLARAAAHAMLGSTALATGAPADLPAILAAVMSDADAAPEPSLQRAGVLMLLASMVLAASTSASPAHEAAWLCRRTLDELATLPTGPVHAHLVALVRANREAFHRVAGDDNLGELARAIADLVALQPEPWLVAALTAHAATLGATMGYESCDAALQAARDELWRCTRECAAEDAPRLLWFVASAGLYEMTRRMSGGAAPMVRSGLAPHGFPVAGMTSLPEMMGLDAVVVIATDATGALLDRDYIELALELADHVTDGRLVSPALRGLLAMLAAGA